MPLVLPLTITWISAILLAFLNGRRRWVDTFALLALLAGFISSVWLLVAVLQEGEITLVTGGWPAGIGITLRADPLGAVFAATANLLLFISLLYESLEEVEERAFPALVLFLAAGLNGLFITADAFNFYVFFEISMTASFVIASYGQQQREIRDTLSFTVVNLVGSAIFLMAIAGLYHLTGTLDMQGIADWVNLVEPRSIILLAVLFFIAFSIKLGLFPFHWWLPSVYRGIRPVAAAILSGVLANIGSYGLLRFGGQVFYKELEFAGPVLVWIGITSVLYGALVAVSRHTEREVLAYSSISQAGYILIGLAVGGPAGFSAAVLFSLVNAFNKTLLFLATGVRGWLVGAAFAIGAFSVAGLPPAVGFFGKAAIFRAGAAAQNPAYLTFIFLGGSLAFVYMFQIFQRHFWPRQRGAVSPFPLRLLILTLAGVIVFLGVWPEPLLAISERAASLLLAGMEP